MVRSEVAIIAIIVRSEVAIIAIIVRSLKFLCVQQSLDALIHVIALHD